MGVKYVCGKTDKPIEKKTCLFCDCGRLTHEELLFRKEVQKMQIINEMAADGLELDEFGYVI